MLQVVASGRLSTRVRGGKAKLGDLEPVWCGSAPRAPVPEPEPFCRSPKSWLRLPYEKTAPPHSFHAGSAPTTYIVWCGSTAGAGARAVQEPHQTGPYSAGGKLAWLSLTAVTCVGLITQGVSFSVTLITLPLTSCTSPCRWITFLLAILTHSAEDGRRRPGLCALPRMKH